MRQANKQNTAQGFPKEPNEHVPTGIGQTWRRLTKVPTATGRLTNCFGNRIFLFGVDLRSKRVPSTRPCSRVGLARLWGELDVEKGGFISLKEIDPKALSSVENPAQVDWKLC